MLYKEWLICWIENCAKPTVKMRTYSQYESIVYKRLIPKFGDYEISDISPLMVQKYIGDLLEKGNIKTGGGLSANTVNQIIAVIQISLKSACALGITEKYNMDKIKRPSVSEKQINAFSPYEQKKLEETVLRDKRKKMIGIIICLYTGLRIGGLIALEWDDIDLKKREMRITKTCYYKSKNRIISTPKTPSSIRTIPLPKQLIPLLKEHKRKSECKYVISEKGESISLRSYQRSFELLQNKIGISHFGFHSLRHTFATRALECGMDVKTLAEILGHKNATITLKRYAHSMTNHKREMMNRLGRLI